MFSLLSSFLPKLRPETGEELLARWEKEEGHDVDLLLISIGSFGSAEQQNPTFARHAASNGQKVRVINIDPKNANNRITANGSCILKDSFSKEKSPQIYAAINRLVTDNSNNPKTLVAVSTYAQPYSHNDFSDIIENNRDKKNVICLQGYFENSPVIILDKNFGSQYFNPPIIDCKKTPTSIKYEDVWSFLYADREGLSKVNFGNDFQIFYRLQELGLSHLEAIASQSRTIPEAAITPRDNGAERLKVAVLSVNSKT